MAGVQELPPWLSYSQFVTTNTAGSRTTASTIVYLPLTYYGPSIPLGTDGVWVWGGLTSPASSSTTRVSTPPTTTALPTFTVSSPGTQSTPPSFPPPTTTIPAPTAPSTSAVPPSGTSTTTTVAGTTSITSPTSSTGGITSPPPISSTLSPSTTIPSTPTTSAGGATTSGTPTVTPPTTNSVSSTSSGGSSSSTSSGASTTSSATSSISSTSSGGPSSSTSSTASSSPTALGGVRPLTTRAIVAIVIVSAFVAVLLILLCFLVFRRRRRRATPAPQGAGSGTNWGEYAVVSAGEHDPESRPGRGEREHDPLVARDAQDPELGEVAPPYAPPRLVTTGQTVQHDDAPSNRTSAASHAQFGTAYTFGNSSEQLVQAPSGVAILSNVPASAESPLVPPRALNPDFLPAVARRTNDSSINSSRSTVPSIAYPDSPVSDVDETAALMTARRVRVDSTDNRNSGGWNFGGLARFGRLSWFTRQSAGPSGGSSPSGSRPPSSGLQPPRPPPQQQEMVEARRENMSPIPAAASSISGSSNRSQYFDAHSRPATPAAPLDHDALDLPIPASTMPPLRRVTSRPEHLEFPPGLTPPSRQRSFAHESSDSQSDGLTVPIVIEGHVDPLEEVPPSAGPRWDSLRGSMSGSSGGRGTGSTMLRQYGSYGSEAVSLASMRSHVGLSPHGSGSRAESHNGSRSGSNSSLQHNNSISSDGRRRVRRPEEAFAPGQRASFGTFGRPDSLEAVSRVGSRGPSPHPSVVFPPLENLTLGSQSSNGSRSRGSTNATATTQVMDPRTGAVMHFPTRMWEPEQQSEADWPEDAWTEFPEGGARWWGSPRTLEEYRSQTGDSGVV